MESTLAVDSRSIEATGNGAAVASDQFRHQSARVFGLLVGELPKRFFGLSEIAADRRCDRWEPAKGKHEKPGEPCCRN